MDPEATLQRLRDLIAEAKQADVDGDDETGEATWAVVGVVAANLIDWLTRGGYAPDWRPRERGLDEQQQAETRAAMARIVADLKAARIERGEP